MCRIKTKIHSMHTFSSSLALPIHLFPQHVPEPNPVIFIHQPVVKNTKAFVCPQTHKVLLLVNEARTALEYALKEQAWIKPQRAHGNYSDRMPLSVQCACFCPFSKNDVPAYLKHFGQIPQVERVVALCRRWEQVFGDCVIYVQCRCHHAGSNLSSKKVIHGQARPRRQFLSFLEETALRIGKTFLIPYVARFML